ncbi:lariat debranching enzyme, C-terminal domain-containing protein [Armillaria borealis]|uniref:Lariat debranching enzyme, C-terminal domain-containing protein n=1 Tax=Armillaria borealis TaxID=47425 RepID=A0AA39JQK1_9AGAR|nr:lariat debranching enzyme, C-terminal domain-containing protein [Armillaria borealis]
MLRLGTCRVPLRSPRRYYSTKTLKVAVEGCCHGKLDDIYKQVASMERKGKYKVDLLLICGDFQATRNAQDLECMAVPPKHKHLNDFPKYYTGQKTAPILTVFIGGNHEASNYLAELHYGGWVAPNQYYLGRSGCIQVNGVRIAGASGIYAEKQYENGYFEKLPYNQHALKSIYRIRQYDIRKLSLLTNPHVFLSHDWPQGIIEHGDLAALLRAKPAFTSEIADGTFGALPLMDLLKALQPEWWFAAHMHALFKATVKHDDSVTNFTALDKCLPRRKCLEVIDVPAMAGTTKLTFDPEWLAITRAFQPFFNQSQPRALLPPEQLSSQLVKKHLQWVLEHVGEDRPVGSVQKFQPTAPGPTRGESRRQPSAYFNQQTEAFCDMLHIPDLINPRTSFWS